MDTGNLGLLTAKAMEQIEDDFSEHADATMGEAVLVYEIFYTDEDGQARNEVGLASSTDNRVHQTGILDWGYDLAKDEGVPAGNDDDD